MYSSIQKPTISPRIKATTTSLRPSDRTSPSGSSMKMQYYLDSVAHLSTSLLCFTLSVLVQLLLHLQRFGLRVLANYIHCIKNSVLSISTSLERIREDRVYMQGPLQS